MAIYHMQAKVVSRGSGRSAVAASAYMSCSRIYNDYDGIQHDYTRKHGLIYQEVMLPPMAPPKWKNREQLWNAVEAAEKTKDSRLAREFVVALPIELDKDSNISLLQNFIQKNFVDMGMCADFAIHDTDGHNPHAHILLTVRPLNENGTWQYKTEKEYLCIKDGEEKGGEGILYPQQGAGSSERIVIQDMAPGVYDIEVQSLSPFEKTLKGTFVIPEKENDIFWWTEEMQKPMKPSGASCWMRWDF